MIVKVSEKLPSIVEGSAHKNNDVYKNNFFLKDKKSIYSH